MQSFKNILIFFYDKYFFFKKNIDFWKNIWSFTFFKNNMFQKIFFSANFNFIKSII